MTIASIAAQLFADHAEALRGRSIASVKADIRNARAGRMLSVHAVHRAHGMTDAVWAYIDAVSAAAPAGPSRTPRCNAGPGSAALRG